MNLCKGTAEVRKLISGDRILLHEHVQLCATVELAHLDGGFDLPVSVYQTRETIAYPDWLGRQVQFGCESSVQSQFLSAQRCPTHGIPEVCKGEVHGPLDLVGEATGQQYPGHVCLDHLYGVDGMWIGFDSQQSLQRRRQRRTRAERSGRNLLRHGLDPAVEHQPIGTTRGRNTQSSESKPARDYLMVTAATLAAIPEDPS